MPLPSYEQWTQPESNKNTGKDKTKEKNNRNQYIATVEETNKKIEVKKTKER